VVSVVCSPRQTLWWLRGARRHFASCWEFVGSLRIPDVRLAVAAPHSAVVRDASAVLVGLIDPPHEPVLKRVGIETQLVQSRLDFLGLSARDRHTASVAFGSDRRRSALPLLAQPV